MTLQPIPLDREYSLLDFVGIAQKSSPLEGPLVEFTETIHATGELTHHQFTILASFGKSTTRIEGLVDHHFIHFTGMDLATDGDAFFERKTLSHNSLSAHSIMDEGGPLFNRTDCKIRLLSHNFLSLIIEAERTLTPAFPKPLIRLIQQYMS